MTNRTYFRHFVAALAPGYALSTVAMVNMCQRDKSSSRNSVLRTEGAREVLTKSRSFAPTSSLWQNKERIARSRRRVTKRNLSLQAKTGFHFVQHCRTPRRTQALFWENLVA
ncbi:hypothetical protein RB195_010392 [Necator americanus]|uniref:Secreted protein n=1 Tax=Necator americanus TaxID=51031 RepID=A0ABR1CXS4_NECAM